MRRTCQAVPQCSLGGLLQGLRPAVYAPSHLTYDASGLSAPGTRFRLEPRQLSRQLMLFEERARSSMFTRFPLTLEKRGIARLLFEEAPQIHMKPPTWRGGIRTIDALQLVTIPDLSVTLLTK